MRTLVFLIARMFLGVALLSVVMVDSALADQLSLLGELEYVFADTEIDNKETGERTETETTRFSQLYLLDMDKDLFPYLSLNAGGTFEINDIEVVRTDEDTTTAEERQNKPYLGLELNGPVLRGALGYRKTELSSSGSNQTDSKDFIDEYTANVGWRPAGLPNVNMEYVYSHFYDDPETRDAINESLVLTSRYRYENYNLNYTHTRNDIDNKLSDSQTQTRNHSGGVNYSRNFWDDSLAMTAGMKFDYSTIAFSGSDERLVRTSPAGAGFFSLDDDANDYRNVSGGDSFLDVNIGGGGGIKAVSVGLFFSLETEVDVIHVLLADESDATLPPNTDLADPSEIEDVAAQFVWSLFVSDDQDIWEEKPIGSVIYSQENNRFEIRPGAQLSAVYMKVVTTPLSSEPDLGDIRIKDVQAYLVVDPTTSEVESLNQYYNLDFDWIYSPRTRFSYETSYQRLDNDLSEVRSSWNNGVSVNHRFNETFTGSSRLLRSDSWRGGKRDVTSHNFAMSLSAAYLEAFNQTLTYSLTTSEDRKGDSHSQALVLRSNLDAYEGVALTLDQGIARKVPTQEDPLTSVFVRAGASLIPNSKLNFNLNYSVAWDFEDEGQDSQTQTGRFSGFWVPLKTLSLGTDIAYRRTSGSSQDSQTNLSRNFFVSWAPLLDGAIQFSVAYNEIGRSGDSDEDLRSLSQNLRWRITDYALLTLSHNNSESESELEKIKSESVFLSLRVYY